MEEKKPDKVRSAAYPAATIEACYDVLNAIKSLGGKSCSYQAVADKMNTSLTTYSFKAKISSSKQYGFIENLKSVIQLSEYGRQLVYPTADTNEKAILLECFQAPILYSKLIQAYQGKALPPANKLANELIKPIYGITTAAKDIAADCFVKNAEFVGALQNGLLTFDGILEVSSTMAFDNVDSSSTDSNSTTPEINSTNSKPNTPQTTPTSKSGYKFQIPMLCGGAAEIYLPEDITPTDIDFFEKSIDVMLPLFMANLKERLLKATDSNNEADPTE